MVGQVEDLVEVGLIEGADGENVLGELVAGVLHLLPHIQRQLRVYRLHL